jgi:hypothetical protein
VVKKPYFSLVLSALVALLAMSLTSTASGQTAARARAAAAPPRYDVAKEITIDATVVDVVTKAEPGMLAGAHAQLTTSSGAVDAHLGTYAMRGTSALRLAAGDQIRVVGVMRTIQGRPVLLVRTVQAGGVSCTIRNAHGIPLRSASACATQPHQNAKGGRP